MTEITLFKPTPRTCRFVVRNRHVYDDLKDKWHWEADLCGEPLIYTPENLTVGVWTCPKCGWTYRTYNGMKSPGWYGPKPAVERPVREARDTRVFDCTMQRTTCEGCAFSKNGKCVL